MKKLLLFLLFFAFLTGCEPEEKEVIVPTYELLGGTEVTAEIGTYVDPGYEADIRLVRIESDYVKDTLGTFTSTYVFAGDLTLTRTIHIVDTTKPEMILNGLEEVFVYDLSSYIEKGVTIVDNSKEDINYTVETQFTNESDYGEYIITYYAEDSSGNENSITRKVVYERKPVDLLALRPLKVVSPFSYEALGEFDINEDGAIDDEEALLVEYLELPDYRLDTFEFLSSFINLQELTLGAIEFDDMTPIQELTSLTTLILRDTDLSKTIDVSYFGDLVTLEISSSNIKGVVGLEQIDNLQHLNLDENDIDDADFLNFNSLRESLISISIDDNNIESIEMMYDFSNLTSMSFSDNLITDIYLLTNLKGLEFIDIDGVPIEVEADFEGHDNLMFLSLNVSKIIDVNHYLEIDTIEELYLTGYNADFETTVKILELIDQGITVRYKNLYNIDPAFPELSHSYTEIALIEGDNLDESGLVVVARDLVDGYLNDNIVYDTIDIPSLAPGTYSYDISITDSDGNTTTESIPLVIHKANMDFSNTVVFVKFADEVRYNAPYESSYYRDLFNGDELSVSDYFDEVSDGRYDTYGYFINNADNMYIDPYPRAYYQPYDEVENPIGYEDEDESYDREEVMIENIATYIKENYNNYGSLDYDINNDGYVDGLSILISGQPDDWEDLLWPHQYSIDPTSEFMIGDAMIRNYNIAFLGIRQNDANSLDLAVLCHEIFHMMEGPDYYHYYSDTDIDTAGYYDLMNSTATIPTEFLAYTKEIYGGWTQSKITVEEGNDTVVTLNKTSMGSNNVINITFPGLSEEIWIEFRVNEGLYDEQLNGDGVLVYYTNKDYYGNSNGLYNDDGVLIDELIIYRDFDFTNGPNGEYIISGDPGIDFPTLYEGGPLSAGIGTNIPLFGADGFPKNMTITVSNFTSISVTVTIDFLD